MTVVTRFAPAPTGHLHVGNIRTALHNFLWARRNGGRFLLRLDDTDRERSTEAFAIGIREDLAWLGLQPDAEHRQSERFDLYDAALERLNAAGRVYPAYETAQELELKRKIQLGRGKPPVYDRAALQLSEADRAALEAEGKRPHWRFKLDHGRPIEWPDLIRGPQHFDPALLSDPIVRREDGSWLYMLPSAVDDIDLGVTHVIRGEDHVANTALQVQMFEALGAAPPAFAHEALLVGSEGKLSKRLGSLGGSGDARGWSGADRAAGQARRIGTSLPVEPVAGFAADRELRLRNLRAGAGAVRHGRACPAQRPHHSSAAVRGGGGAASEGMDAATWRRSARTWRVSTEARTGGRSCTAGSRSSRVRRPRFSRRSGGGS
jgi:glutamyl-tRNA synthetase